MPTDAPDGNVNAFVVRGSGKGRKKAPEVTTVDTAVVAADTDVAPAVEEVKAESKPAKATTKK